MGADGSVYARCCGTGRNDHEINTEVYNPTSIKKHKQIENLQSDLKNARMQVKELRELHDTITNAAEMKYTQLNTKFETERQQKSILMNQIQESNKDFEKDVEKYKNKASQLQAQMQETEDYAETEIDKYKLSNKRLQSQMTDYSEYRSKTQTLQRENSKLVSIKTQLHNEISSLNEQIKQFKGKDSEEIIALKTQIQSLALRKHSLEQKQSITLTSQQQNTALQNEISELEKKLESTQLEFEEYKQSEIDNSVHMRHSIINEQVIIATLKQQITTLQTKINEYEDSEQSVDIEAETEYNEDDADDEKILSYEKNISALRVMHTLERSVTGTDIAKLILDQYKSVGDEDEVGAINEDEEESEYSSLDLQEQKEITRRKSIEMKEKKMSEDATAMQKELQRMHIESAKALEKQMSSMKEMMEKISSENNVHLRSNAGSNNTTDMIDDRKSEFNSGDDGSEDLQTETESESDSNQSNAVLNRKVSVSDAKTDGNDNDYYLNDNVSVSNDMNINGDATPNAVGRKHQSISISVSNADVVSPTPDHTHMHGSPSVSEMDDETLLALQNDASNPHHMFRFRSIAKWEPLDLVQRKKEMTQQMIHLVKHHTQTALSTKNLQSSNEKVKSRVDVNKDESKNDSQ